MSTLFNVQYINFQNHEVAQLQQLTAIKLKQQKTAKN